MKAPQNQKTSVLVLNPYFPTLGGGEKYMAHLCQFLENFLEDVTIEILVANYNQITIHDPNYPGIDELNAKFGVVLRSTRLKAVETLDATDLSRLSAQYDVFINHMYWSRLRGNARTNIYLCMFPPYRNVSDSILGKFLDPWRRSNRFFSGYQKVIAISEYTNQWLHQFWNQTLRSVDVVPPPVYWEQEGSNRYHEKEKRNVILAVGRFFVGGHSKQQEAMIRLFLRNEDSLGSYELHLAGGVAPYGPDKEYVDQLIILAAGHRVFFHFNASPVELDSLYRSAKVFWHATGMGLDADREPDRMEHFGITTVEAMTYGAVPVVIGKGGQKEILGSGEAGFNWNSEEEWLDYTRLLTTDESIRKTMAARAPERAKSYSVENFVQACRRTLAAILKDS